MQRERSRKRRAWHTRKLSANETNFHCRPLIKDEDEETPADGQAVVGTALHKEATRQVSDLTMF